jgi:hypothetical protein
VHALSTTQVRNVETLRGISGISQPFFKIALGIEIWNIADVILGIGLPFNHIKIH